MTFILVTVAIAYTNSI